MVQLGQNYASYTIEIKLLLTSLHTKKKKDSHTETEEMQKCIFTALLCTEECQGKEYDKIY